MESLPVKGTKFEIFFPLPEETKDSIEIKRDSQKKTEEKKIIVISDDENNRFIIKALMENFGYEVYGFSKLEELFFAMKSSIDIKLLYLDQSSFKKEEFEKIYPILVSKPETKILLSINYNNKEIIEKVSYNENIKIIYKPFKYDEVVNILRKLLNI